MKRKLILLLIFIILIITLPFVSYLVAPNGSTDTASTSVAKISHAAEATPKLPSKKTPALQTGTLQVSEGTTSSAVKTLEMKGISSEAPENAYPKITETTFRIKDDATGDILTVSNKEFLIGTLACELYPNSHTEALKAQAVAAYTYYSKLRQEQRDLGKEYDFSANTKAWLYYTTKAQMKAMWGENFNSYYRHLEQAVDSVLNQTLRYEGQLITACYHAMSSGQTENGEDIWGGNYPYLIAVASPLDKYADNYKTTYTVSSDEFYDIIMESYPSCKLSGNAKNWINEITRTDSGSVKTIQVGKETLDGVQIRILFNLRSSNFTVTYKKKQFHFTVMGYGHGVGMSQTGAMVMAKQGYLYDEILAWYYPGTELIS